MDYIFYTFTGVRAKGVTKGLKKYSLKPNAKFGLAVTKGGSSLVFTDTASGKVIAFGIEETVVSGLIERASKLGKRVPAEFKGIELPFIKAVRSAKKSATPKSATQPRSNDTGVPVKRNRPTGKGKKVVRPKNRVEYSPNNKPFKSNWTKLVKASKGVNPEFSKVSGIYGDELMGLFSLPPLVSEFNGGSITINLSPSAQTTDGVSLYSNLQKGNVLETYVSASCWVESDKRTTTISTQNAESIAIFTRIDDSTSFIGSVKRQADTLATKFLAPNAFGKHISKDESYHVIEELSENIAMAIISVINKAKKIDGLVLPD